MKASTKSIKIYFSLLALCYLEVVLWTSCLAAAHPHLPGAAPDSHSYLIRETGNLKYAGQATVPLPSFETLIDLRSTNLHKQLEQYCQQQRFQTLSFSSPALLQPGLLDLRNIQESTGLPAPSTGIEAYI